MAHKVSKLKLKNLLVDSDNEDEKVSGKFELDLPLEKLNLGPKKKLLVLNLGGLLVHRVNRRSKCEVQRYIPDLVHGNFLVFKRPYCDQFMEFCLERFEVGLWSSAMFRNMDPILESILSGLKKKLAFVWDQEKCIDSGIPTLGNRRKSIFLKQLKKIWENFYGERFSESNTLLIDDEPHVALLNSPNTAVFPPPYDVKNTSDTFLDAKGEMVAFLEGLVDADDVPTYVKEHPFGQPAITISHKDWDYYAKIVRAFGYPHYGSD